MPRQRRHYYKSVETLSIGAWWDAQKTNDFSHLLNKRQSDIRAMIDATIITSILVALSVMFYTWIILILPPVLFSLYKSTNARKDQTLKSLEVWKGIQDSYIKLIGIGDQSEQLKQLKLSLHGHYCDFIGTIDDNGKEVKGKQFSDNWIRITKNNIEALENEIENQTEVTTGKIVSLLQDWKGRDIDVYKVTVQRFFEDMEYYSEKAKQAA